MHPSLINHDSKSWGSPSIILSRLSKPREEPELDHLAEARVELGESFEGTVQGKKVDRRADSDSVRHLEEHTRLIPAPFSRLGTPGVIDQNAPHSSRCQAHVSGPVVRGAALRASEPDIGFMYQRRGLQSMPRACVAHVPSSQRTELFVQQWEEFFFRPLFAAVQVLQKTSGIVARLHDRCPPNWNWLRIQLLRVL